MREIEKVTRRTVEENKRDKGCKIDPRPVTSQSVSSRSGSSIQPKFDILKLHSSI